MSFSLFQILSKAALRLKLKTTVVEAHDIFTIECPSHLLSTVVLVRYYVHRIGFPAHCLFSHKKAQCVTVYRLAAV